MLLDPGLGQSLPDLHSLGGSTDSLIAESEDFLRHSIDSILSFDGASPRPSHSRSHSTQSVTSKFNQFFCYFSFINYITFENIFYIFLEGSLLIRSCKFSVANVWFGYVDYANSFAIEILN